MSTGADVGPFDYVGAGGVAVARWTARGADGRVMTVTVAPKNEGAFSLGGRRFEVIAEVGGQRRVVAEETSADAARRAARRWMSEVAP